MVHVTIEDIQKYIADDVDTISDTPNFALDRLLRKGKNKKLIGLMKDKLRRQIVRKLLDIQRFKRQ